LAVATPMHMIAPVRAGTLTVVWVKNSIQTMPASAAGSAVMMMNGSSPGLEIHHDQHVNQHDGATRPISRPLNDAFMVCDLAAQDDLRTLGQVLSGASMILSDLPDT
jgi:hypothetical protein